MPTDHEKFWSHTTYAVVGHSAKRKFPMLTYEGLRKRGKKVFAVDPSVKQIDGHRAYDDFSKLPTVVDAVVIEVPKEETADWVRRAARAGIGRVWLHQGTDTPQAMEAVEEYGLDAHTGTCAVIYLSEGFNIHAVHRGINKLIGKY